MFLALRQILRTSVDKNLSYDRTHRTKDIQDEDTASIMQSDLRSIDSFESICSSPISSPGCPGTESITSSPNNIEFCQYYDDSYNSRAPYLIRQDHLKNDTSMLPSVEIIKSTSVRGSIKRVQFCKTIRVLLIPCRKELDVIKNDLWLNRDQIDDFKVDAFLEMKEFMERNESSVKEAMLHLYQPMQF